MVVNDFHREHLNHKIMVSINSGETARNVNWFMGLRLRAEVYGDTILYLRTFLVITNIDDYTKTLARDIRGTSSGKN